MPLSVKNGPFCAADNASSQIMVLLGIGTILLLWVYLLSLHITEPSTSPNLLPRRITLHQFKTTYESKHQNRLSTRTTHIEPSTTVCHKEQAPWDGAILLCCSLYRQASESPRRRRACYRRMRHLSRKVFGEWRRTNFFAMRPCDWELVHW